MSAGPHNWYERVFALSNSLSYAARAVKCHNDVNVKPIPLDVDFSMTLTSSTFFCFKIWDGLPERVLAQDLPLYRRHDPGPGGPWGDRRGPSGPAEAGGQGHVLQQDQAGAPRHRRPLFHRQPQARPQLDEEGGSQGPHLDGRDAQGLGEVVPGRLLLPQDWLRGGLPGAA